MTNQKSNSSKNPLIKLKLKADKVRAILLIKLLGKNLTIFIVDESTSHINIEVTDSKRRIKLFDMSVYKLSDIRYRLVNHRLS